MVAAAAEASLGLEKPSESLSQFLNHAIPLLEGI
jgi:hypothetical protein